MREQLQSHLNRHYSLSQIVHILHETYQPLSSIAKLPIIPQLGIPVSHWTIQRFFDFVQISFWTETTSTGHVILHHTTIADPSTNRLFSNVLPGNSSPWRWIGFYSWWSLQSLRSQQCCWRILSHPRTERIPIEICWRVRCVSSSFTVGRR